MTAQQPTIARRSLGRALTRHREAKGLTRAEAGRSITYSWQTMQRIEEGKQATRPLVVEKLCSLYGITGAEMSHLTGLAARAKERGWWEPYIDGGTKEGTRPDFPLFLETEQIATHIRVLETEVIPGLLQTEAYLLALQAAQLPMPEDVAAGVRALRTHRQRLMAERADDPRQEYLFSRSAIDHLEALPADAAEEQRDRLLAAAEVENVQIRVIASLHAGAAGAFAVLAPPEEEPPFVYIDDLDGCRYIEDLDVVSTYDRAFTLAWDKSVPIKEYLR